MAHSPYWRHVCRLYGIKIFVFYQGPGFDPRLCDLFSAQANSAFPPKWSVNEYKCLLRAFPRWIRGPSNESQTPIRLTLQKLEISAGSMGHLAHKGLILASLQSRRFVNAHSNRLRSQDTNCIKSSRSFVTLERSKQKDGLDLVCSFDGCKILFLVTPLLLCYLI